MKEKRWGYNEAFTYVKSRRSCINPNPGFVKQLKSYEEEIGLNN
jgi:hypothetical protein